MRRLLSFCSSRNISNIVQLIEPGVALAVRNPPLFTSFFCREFTDSGTNMDLSNMRKSYKSEQEVGGIFWALTGCYVMCMSMTSDPIQKNYCTDIFFILKG